MTDVKVVGAGPAGRAADRDPIDEAEVDLSIDLGGVTLDNPVTTASGCFASGVEIDRFFDVTELGAIVVKSITREPRQGLPTPRMAETPSGMLNAIGLQNPGVDAWIERDLAWLRERGAKVIVSIAGNTVEDFAHVAGKVAGQPGIVAVEVNLSCPNVEHRGLVFACHAGTSADVVSAVVAQTGDLPVFAKLTPDVTDVTEVARSVVDAGATGCSLINTTLGMAIDPETGRPKIRNTFGGLSGPAVKPIAVRNVYQVHRALPDIPIIGMGGIRTAEDAVEIIRAGASAVAIGTATFADPFASQQVLHGLRRWMAQRGFSNLGELRGKVVPW